MSRRTLHDIGGADERNGCLEGASMPRYEFRAWSSGFEGIARHLMRLASSRDTEEAHGETYLVAAARPGRNAKIRNGSLSLKALVGTRDGLERWQPRLDEAFPVSAGVLAAWLLPELGLPVDGLRRGAYDEEAFLAELIGPAPEVTPVALTKARQRFRLSGVRAEIASLTVRGRRLQSLALESVDPASVRALLACLGLEAARNVGYAEALRAILRDSWDFQV